jgi:hypothetical protein
VPAVYHASPRHQPPLVSFIALLDRLVAAADPLVAVFGETLNRTAMLLSLADEQRSCGLELLGRLGTPRKRRLG